jgi:hypothetical protein
MTTNNTFKYFAFISYNSKDTAWGKRLQKKLEHYRMPSTLCSQHGWKRNPVSPVFFAPTDIQPGGLSEELQERLKASQHLIVICSPNSAQSKWVGKEIEFFHSLGRTENIHFFIVEGTPHSGDPETECFNPVIEQLDLPEILGANIHEKIYRWPWLNRERAYVQLVSKLLGVEFDTIWQRHKRQLIRKAVAWTLGILAVLAALIVVWRGNQPFNAETRVQEVSVHNDNLPPLKEAVVTMTLDNETKTDTLKTLDDALVFTNIPHRFLNQPVRLTVTCRDFLAVDTTVSLSRNVTLNLQRDPAVYGDVHFRLFNPDTETFLSNKAIRIDGIETLSDDQGNVSLFIPLASQKTSYQVTADFPLLSDSLHMPCGNDDVILTQ